MMPQTQAHSQSTKLSTDTIQHNLCSSTQRIKPNQFAGRPTCFILGFTLFGLVVVSQYMIQGKYIVDPGSVCGFYIWRADRKQGGQIAKQFVLGEQ